MKMEYMDLVNQTTPHGLHAVVAIFSFIVMVFFHHIFSVQIMSSPFYVILTEVIHSTASSLQAKACESFDLHENNWQNELGIEDEAVKSYIAGRQQWIQENAPLQMPLFTGHFQQLWSSLLATSIHSKTYKIDWKLLEQTIKEKSFQCDCGQTTHGILSKFMCKRAVQFVFVNAFYAKSKS